MTVANIEEKAVNSIRALSIDAINKANSGHPGMPLGSAPMAYQLWTHHMKHNPANPRWFNRDRFVLSAGHGSMLLYSLLHVTGYSLSMEDLKNFRQWESKTPGHPEFGHTAGVDATSGPLGQGIAMAVGMAMAEAHLAATYNRPELPVVDHFTYSICGDGCLMEGVSAEAASLAGHLKLGKLITLYDSNNITLDGELDMSFSEDVKKRFEAYGWQVLYVENGNDLEEINQALIEAKSDLTRPTLIEVRTVIGYGSQKQGTSSTHGAPLGIEDAKHAKAQYGLDPDKEFFVEEEVYAHFRKLVKEKGEEAEQSWLNQLDAYKIKYPELYRSFQRDMGGELPEGWAEQLPVYEEGTSLASRASSGETINAIANAVPSFFGGSADLSESTKTMMKGIGDFTAASYEGRNIWFGVREFAMGAALNGMALHGGLKVFGGTFFVFSDYLKAAIRMSALMNLPVTYVFTHDSIAVGEDGPTHEPIEQLAALRSIPNLNVIRPADGNETVAAWKEALQSTATPTVLVLSRQNLATIQGTKEYATEGVQKGAYTVKKTENPQVLLLATGSEVNLALEAAELLQADGVEANVISMPSFFNFEKQSKVYKESILPNTIRERVSIEMGRSFGWHQYVGLDGLVIGVDTFGASAPGNIVLKEYGFTAEAIKEKVSDLLK
ncbi:MAG: transketolase [Bacillus sp. (in: firmicutes)]